MADVKWIKIVTDIFDDEKIRIIEKTIPDADAILVIWFKLLCLTGKSNQSGLLLLSEKIAYTDEMLSSVFDRPLNTVRLAIEVFQRFHMVEVIENKYYITNWEKYQNIEGMEKIREQTRKRVARFKENKKLLSGNVSGNVKVTLGNATDKEIDKEKEKNKKHMSTPSELSVFFDSIWLLYPKKEGKGQVKEKTKQKLYIIGYDEIKRAIERYINAKKNTDKKYWQNGSTFFNSGYIDYLDNNVNCVSNEVTREELECLTDVNGNTVFEDINGNTYDAVCDERTKKIKYVKRC